MKVLKMIRAGLIRLLEGAIMASMAFLVLAVCWQVVSRYVFSKPAGWTEELATLLLVWVSLLGASAAYVRKAHLGVDYFVLMLGAKSRALVDCAVHLLVAFFAGYVMVGGGWKLAMGALKFHQKTPALGLERGHVYLVIAVSGAFILLFALEMLVESVVRFRHPETKDA